MKAESRPIIAVIGSGRVATHLAEALSSVGEVCPVAPRTLEGLPSDASLYIISVSDDAVAEVAEKINKRVSGGIIAHTSGSLPLEVIPERRGGRGVFYPLQTFSKEVKPDFRTIPIFTEGDSENVSDTLYNIAALLTGSAHKADADTRLTLHIAAVLACNFTNRLFTHADRILSAADLKFEYLFPLIQETIRKAMIINPALAQTGPAARHDKATIRRHLEFLENFPETRRIYELLSTDIENECN